jgi:flagellar biosynthesis GTPase FlhF
MTEFNFLDDNSGNELLDADTLAVTELIKDREIPRFITIEGPIGVGKTT